MCVHVCEGGIWLLCLCGESTWVWDCVSPCAHAGQRGPSFCVVLHLIAWDKKLPKSARLIDQQASEISLSPDGGIIGTDSHASFSFYTCARDWNAGLPSCTANSLTNLATSPVPVLRVSDQRFQCLRTVTQTVAKPGNCKFLLKFAKTKGKNVEAPLRKERTLGTVWNVSFALKDPHEAHWVTQKQSSKVEDGGHMEKRKIINVSKKRKDKAEYDWNALHTLMDK